LFEPSRSLFFSGVLGNCLLRCGGRGLLLRSPALLHIGLLALRPSIYGLFRLLSLAFNRGVALGSCDLGLKSLALELVLLLRGFELLFALKLLCLRRAFL
jgi:hypothetical protein